MPEIQKQSSKAEFSVYIVRCNDATYYTGIAVDVDRRVAEHRSGPRGAKYLKGRGPLTLVFSEIAGDRSAALRIEHRIKKSDRTLKEALIDGRITLADLMSDQVSRADPRKSRSACQIPA